AVVRRIYGNAHAYHINSISLNIDGETFISADDLRINLWNMEISNQSFSNYSFIFVLSVFPTKSISLDIVDIKPANMEELTEVITSAEFHPRSSHYLAYSSSKGVIRLGDLRQSALCDNHAKSKRFFFFFFPNSPSLS